MESIVFLNGRFVVEKEATVSAVSPGLMYGWGLFETMRSYEGHIVRLKAHLLRMKRGCRTAGVRPAFSFKEAEGFIHETVKKNGLRDAAVRMAVWKSETGADVLITARRYQGFSSGVYRQGLRACVSEMRQAAGPGLACLKTASYLYYRLARLDAQARGFDEAVILNTNGTVAEGSASNVFFIKEKEVFTPSLSCGCLEGITRGVIISFCRRYGIRLVEGKYTIPDLLGADEAFLTNSLMGVMPLAAIERKTIGTVPAPRGLTPFFMKQYARLLLHAHHR